MRYIWKGSCWASEASGIELGPTFPSTVGSPNRERVALRRNATLSGSANTAGTAIAEAFVGAAIKLTATAPLLVNDHTRPCV
jgi:hypothetical protein